jgi:type IV secretion system protein VirD4
MYALARTLLVGAVVAAGYCLAVLMAIGWPWSSLALGSALVWWYRSRKRRSTALGSARWAGESDLRRAGMLNAAAGLILGRFPMQRDFPSRLKTLVSGDVPSEQACREFCVNSAAKANHLVRLPQAIHTLAVSPSGGGKGVSLIIPWLLSCDESCVVVDFKGENARLTAEHRRKAFGHQVVILDPFRAVATQPDCFNPLDFIDKNNPLALDECADLANALVVRTGEEREPHWNDSAEAWIKGMLALVVQHGELGMRSLQTVRDLFSQPDRLDMAVKAMRESTAWEGMLARVGGQLAQYVDKEKSSTLTTVARHLRFLDTLAIADSTKASSFNPADLLSSRRMTIYLVLPAEHMRVQSPMLRTWLSSFLKAVVRGGLQETNKVHFILDEAASIGPMEAIDDAIDKLRGYGVRLQFYFQSLGQLKKCFPKGGDLTLLSNTSQIYFGTNDTATAEQISSRLGEQTIVLESGGTSSSNTRQWGGGHHGQDTGSFSNNSNSNWQLQASKLCKLEEVINLSPRVAITFAPGLPPIWTNLLRYYEEPNFGKPLGWIRRSADALTTLLSAVFICGTLVFMAVMLTIACSQTASAVSAERFRGSNTTPSVPVVRTYRPTENRH